MNRKCHGNEKGSTLVEQILLTGIVGLTLAVALTALSTTALGLNNAAAKSEAMALATGQLEHVRNVAFAAAATTYAAGVTPPDGYALSTAAAPVPSTNGNIQKITVSVTRAGKTLVTLEALKMNRP